MTATLTRAGSVAARPAVAPVKSLALVHPAVRAVVPIRKNVVGPVAPAAPSSMSHTLMWLVGLGVLYMILKDR